MVTQQFDYCNLKRNQRQGRRRNQTWQKSISACFLVLTLALSVVFLSVDFLFAQAPNLYNTPSVSVAQQGEQYSVVAPRTVNPSTTTQMPQQVAPNTYPQVGSQVLPNNTVYPNSPIISPQQVPQTQYLAQSNPSSYTTAPAQVPYANPSFQPVVPEIPEHPLGPVLRWAKQGRPQISSIQDYTAILRKQENINGRLQDGHLMEIKVRHRPFSVYLKFLAPKSVDGQEVIFVEGLNNGKMWAHGVGVRKIVGTQSLDPQSTLAMTGNKYPVTDIGVLNLIDKLVEVGEEDVKYGECNVQYYEKAKLGGRACTCVEVIHPKQYKEFRFHIARIYIDTEYNIPIRYESYDWPKKPGEKPVLLEAYSYENLQINNGLTDEDFSITNKKYAF